MTNLGRRSAVVIGGGLVGASVAWGLARGGAKPLVLDEGDLAQRASRANFALVWVQGKGLGYPDYALWTRASAERWPRFAAALEAETGVDVGLRQPGGFSFYLSEAEMERGRRDRERIVRETGGRGAPFTILSPAELRDRLPAIGPTVVGAAFSPLDGDVNSLRLFHALHVALAKHGAEYRANHAVQSIEPVAAGFRIAGDWGEVVAERLVLAAGVANEFLAPMVGLNAPMRRSKGQVIVTERCAPFFAYPSATMRQTDEGGIMIGDSEDTASTSILADPRISALMAARAIRVFPALGALNIVRTWAGFRIKSLDGFPIYEQSESPPGAFVVSCHSGVTLAANHALELAPQILAGQLDPALKPFAAGRFHVPQDC